MLLLFIYKIIRLLQQNPEFSVEIVAFNKSEQLEVITKEGHHNIVYVIDLYEILHSYFLLDTPVSVLHNFL